MPMRWRPISRRRKKPAITISDERGVLLDTGGGVIRALPLLGNKPFLIHNSDSVWIEGVGSNIARLIAGWDPEKMDSLMLLANGVTSLGYDGRGDFMMDADGMLSRRPEQKDAPFVFTGVSIAHPRMFEGAPDGKFSLNKLWIGPSSAAVSTACGSTAPGCTSASPEALAEAERWIDASKAG